MCISQKKKAIFTWVLLASASGLKWPGCQSLDSIFGDQSSKAIERATFATRGVGQGLRRSRGLGMRNEKYRGLQAINGVPRFGTEEGKMLVELSQAPAAWRWAQVWRVRPQGRRGVGSLGRHTIRENAAMNFPLVAGWPLHEGDVRDFDFEGIEDTIDLVAGGPPCQPFSLGGRHRARRMRAT